jgi:Tol biopolymer transport system component
MREGYIFSWLMVVFLLLQAESVYSQQFGRNKPHYTTFDFKIKKSPHFALYHYLNNDDVPETFLAACERWYDYERIIFRDTFLQPNPVILYANHADFQQTTAIMGTIGVGTGGVTEALKNRVVMPLMELNSQTNHVLGHELVHAFQYRMFRNSKDTLSLADIQSIPLWMVEGLAEYLSISNVDPHTAMWMRDAVRENDFPSLEDLTRGYEYFPYRYGQAFWAFIAGVFGDTVVYPLFLNTAKVGYEEAIQAVTGLEEEAFSEVWQKNMIDYYGKFKPPLRSDSLAGKLLIDNNTAGDLNIAPVLSPDGNYVTFLSQKNFFTIDLFLADARTGEVLTTLSSTARESHIDDFSFIESAGTWSPSSDRFAFSVFSEGQSMLTIVELGGNNQTTTIPIPGVPYFSNPSWSPDGEHIVVSGIADGQGDLFLYNLKDKTVRQLTNHWYSEIQPKWSQDGSFILFVSDRPPAGRSYDPKSLQLCLLNVAGNEITVLDIFHGAENLNPVFSPDNQSVYFLSNRDGFRNLYSVDLASGDIFQLTDYFTGISGITAYSPAISVSHETGNVCYTYYAKNQYSIYIAKPYEFIRKPIISEEVDFSAGTLPPAHRALDIVNHHLDQVEFNHEKQFDAPNIPYKPKLSLEYIGNQVGVGVSTGSFGSRTGMAGAVNMLFGDMLGYHRLFAALSLNGQIYDFGGQVAYLNQRRKINWGVSLSHTPYRSAFMGIVPDTLFIKEDTVLTDNVIIDVVRTFESNASVFSYWILSTRQRLEAGAGYSSYSMRIDRYQTHYQLGLPIKEEHDKLDAPEGYRLGNAYAAYIFDNSYFGLTSPLRGKRYRFEIEKTYDELDYYTIMMDYRHYLFFNPTSLAFRFLHAGRHGKDAESSRIYPLSFAYPTLTRGNSLDNIAAYSDEETGAFSINQIYGSRILVGNAEWRIPLTGPERLARFKSRIFLTELSLFVDAGVAWDSSSTPKWKQRAESPEDRIPLLSSGLSLRVNLFGAMILEGFYAFPWRGDHFEKGVFGLNFAPGW